MQTTSIRGYKKKAVFAKAVPTTFGSIFRNDDSLDPNGEISNP